MTNLCIHRKPSCQLGIILVLAHFFAAGLLWLLTLSLHIQVIMNAILLCSLIYYLRQDALLTTDNAVIAFTLSDEMICTVITRCGKSLTCNVMNSTFVTPYLTVLNLKPGGKLFARSVVILSDSLNTEEFRQLRVWLRWKWRKID